MQKISENGNCSAFMLDVITQIAPYMISSYQNSPFFYHLPLALGQRNATPKFEPLTYIPTLLH